MKFYRYNISILDFEEISKEKFDFYVQGYSYGFEIVEDDQIILKYLGSRNCPIRLMIREA